MAKRRIIASMYVDFDCIQRCRSEMGQCELAPKSGLRRKREEIAVKWNRREFVGISVLAGASLAVEPLSKAQDAPSQAPSVRLEGRMTVAPATKYRPYTSKPAQSAQSPTWVQFDLGSAFLIEAIRLYPGFDSYWDIWAIDSSTGFPARLRIEASNDAAMSDGAVLFDGTRQEASRCARPDHVADARKSRGAIPLCSPHRQRVAAHPRRPRVRASAGQSRSSIRRQGCSRGAAGDRR